MRLLFLLLFIWVPSGSLFFGWEGEKLSPIICHHGPGFVPIKLVLPKKTMGYNFPSPNPLSLRITVLLVVWLLPCTASGELPFRLLPSHLSLSKHLSLGLWMWVSTHPAGVFRQGWDVAQLKDSPPSKHLSRSPPSCLPFPHVGCPFYVSVDVSARLQWETVCKRPSRGHVLSWWQLCLMN